MDDDDRSDHMVASSLSRYFKIMKTLLTDIDHEYWMKYAGFDGRLDSLLSRLLLHRLLADFDQNILALLHSQHNPVLCLVHTDSYIRRHWHVDYRLTQKHREDRQD